MRNLTRHLTYSNVASTLCLFLLLAGGTAYALDGSNTVFTDDIVNGEVKNDDLAANAVGSGKIADQQVKNSDLGIGASSSNTIADGGVQGIDVANNSLKGADIDEATLDIGDGARAYARVFAHVFDFCTDGPGGDECTFDHSKGVTKVRRVFKAHYCVTAPGLSPADVAAAVTVEARLTLPSPGQHERDDQRALVPLRRGGVRGHHAPPAHDHG